MTSVLIALKNEFVTLCNAFCSCKFSDGRARKRRRTTETVDIEDRLESLITRVGEKVQALSAIHVY